MAYETQNFKDGEALTADQLNHIERGVLNNSQTVAQVQQEAGPAIVCEATGEAVAVSDASDRALQGLILYGKTSQNGTPSPSNPVPLVSPGDGGSIGVTVAGKNVLYHESSTKTINGVTFTVHADKSITVNGTATANAFYYLSNIRQVPKGDYILSGCPSGGGENTYRIWVRSDAYYRDTGAQIAFALKEEISEVAICIAANATVNNLVFRPMLRSATIADSTYEPYKEQTLSIATPNGLPGIPVSSGGNYTDESGQAWICDEVDLARGERVKWFAVDVLTGEEEWFEYAERPGTFNALGTGIAYGGKCSHYPVNYEFVDGSMNLNYTVRNIIFDSRFAGNVDGLKAFLAEQYAAGTPVTVLRRLHADGGGGKKTALTAEELAAYAALHTNKPNTTVLNDAGAGQKLAYVADTKLYIDNKFTEMTNAIIASGANV